MGSNGAVDTGNKQLHGSDLSFHITEKVRDQVDYARVAGFLLSALALSDDTIRSTGGKS